MHKKMLIQQAQEIIDAKINRKEKNMPEHCINPDCNNAELQYDTNQNNADETICYCPNCNQIYLTD